MMTPKKQVAFRTALVLFALFSGVFLYHQGVLENIDLVVVSIISVALGLVALALYKAISDDDSIE